MIIQDRMIFASLAVFALLFFGCPHHASCSQLPFKGVMEYETAGKNDAIACELKKRLIETIAAVKNIAAEKAVHLISFESSSAFMEGRAEKNAMRVQFNLVSDDLLNVSNFLEKLSEENNAVRSAINSFSLNRQAAPKRNAGAEKPFLYYFELKLYMSDDAKEMNASSALAADLAALIKFGGRKFEFSSTIYTEFNSRLMTAGTFSLKGTKKELADFISSGGLKKLSLRSLSERDFGARPFHITLPFTADFVFNAGK